jgi:ABC-type multidrug transport system ATPase subunit
MMQLDNFTFKIHDKILFKEVDIVFEANKIHTIYGDNGIGKTTFFNILTGQIRNYLGKIILNLFSCSVCLLVVYIKYL